MFPNERTRTALLCLRSKFVEVSSPAAGEGKSLISSNLAVAFAEVGRRTLLIDADTRRGDAHKLLAREQSPGLVDYLKERGVDTAIYYPVPLHLQRAFSYLGYKAGDLPIAEAAAKETLALPIAAELLPDEISYVVDCITTFCRR